MPQFVEIPPDDIVVAERLEADGSKHTFAAFRNRYTNELFAAHLELDCDEYYVADVSSKIEWVRLGTLVFNDTNDLGVKRITVQPFGTEVFYSKDYEHFAILQAAKISAIGVDVPHYVDEDLDEIERRERESQS